VAGIRTTAEKTKDGKHYIVNGTKKWITNGVFCDYFVTGVKTGKPEYNPPILSHHSSKNSSASFVRLNLADLEDFWFQLY
jgi:hypothetical protein